MPPSTAASSRARKAPIRFEGEENSLKPKQVKKTSRSKPKTTSKSSIVSKSDRNIPKVQLDLSNDDSSTDLDELLLNSSLAEVSILAPASGEIDIIVNGKGFKSFDRRNIDLNLDYDVFLDQLYEWIAKKARLAIEKVEESSKTIQWFWNTVQKSQGKVLPRYSDLENTEHYSQLQRDVKNSAVKNPSLANMILRIHVDLRTVSSDIEDEVEEVLEPETPIIGRPSATTRQWQALKSMPKTDYSKKHEELRNHLQCDQHKNDEFCWKPKKPPYNGKVCIPLTSNHLHWWTTAIINNSATLFIPPETKEFWELEAEYQSGKRKALKSKSSDCSPQRFGNVQVFCGPGGFGSMNATSTTTSNSSSPGPSDSISQAGPARKRTCSYAEFPSPIKGFTVNQHNDDGLLAFVTWCRDTTDDPEWLNIYESLWQQRVGIDVIKAASRNATQCSFLLERLARPQYNIGDGYLLRIIHRFRMWEEHLEREG